MEENTQGLRDDQKKEAVIAKKRQLIHNGGFVRYISGRAARLVRPTVHALWFLAAESSLPDQSTEDRLIELVKICLWDEKQNVKKCK